MNFKQITTLGIMLVAITIMSLPGDVAQEAYGETISYGDEINSQDGTIYTPQVEWEWPWEEDCDFTEEPCDVNY